MEIHLGGFWISSNVAKWNKIIWNKNKALYLNESLKLFEMQAHGEQISMIQIFAVKP